MGGITPTPKMAIFAPRTVPYTAPKMAAFAPNMALIIHRGTPRTAPYTALIHHSAPKMALVLIAIHRRLLSFFGTAPSD